MDTEKKPVILKWDSDSENQNTLYFDADEVSFETVLNSACERLRDTHIQFSIRRIREMDKKLDILEKELDAALETHPISRL